MDLLLYITDLLLYIMDLILIENAYTIYQRIDFINQLTATLEKSFPYCLDYMLIIFE